MLSDEVGRGERSLSGCSLGVVLYKPKSLAQPLVVRSGLECRHRHLPAVLPQVVCVVGQSVCGHASLQAKAQQPWLSLSPSAVGVTGMAMAPPGSALLVVGYACV